MIDYEEDWLVSLIGRRAGSVSAQACYFAVPSTLLTLALLALDDHVPELRRDVDLMTLNQSTVWAALSAALMLMVSFRAKNANDRFWEGAGLLHQMRGEWFDTVSNAITFTLEAKFKKPHEVMTFRHTIVRLMSLAHGSALEEISSNCFDLKTIDAHGLDKDTLRHLRSCHHDFGFNKVEVLLHFIQSLILNAQAVGIIDVPSPIVSRIFQTFSRGFVHFLNAKKITDTKFPFPFVQLIIFLLLIFAIATPVVISSFLTNKPLAAIATFVPVFAVASINYIAMQLENPYGQDDNDLPINLFQVEMDSSLLTLLHPMADHISSTSPKAERDFETLVKLVRREEIVANDQDARSQRQSRRASIISVDESEHANSQAYSSEQDKSQGVDDSQAGRQTSYQSWVPSIQSDLSRSQPASPKLATLQESSSSPNPWKIDEAKGMQCLCADRQMSIEVKVASGSCSEATGIALQRMLETDPKDVCSDPSATNAQLSASLAYNFQCSLEKRTSAFVASLESLTNAMEHKINTLMQGIHPGEALQGQATSIQRLQFKPAGYSSCSCAHSGRTDDIPLKTESLPTDKPTCPSSLSAAVPDPPPEGRQLI